MSNLCPMPLHGRKWRHLAGAGVPRSKKGRAPQKFEVRLHSFLRCEYNEMWCTWCISRSKLVMYKIVIFVCCIFFGWQGHEDFHQLNQHQLFTLFLFTAPFSPPKWLGGNLTCGSAAFAPRLRSRPVGWLSWILQKIHWVLRWDLSSATPPCASLARSHGFLQQFLVVMNLQNHEFVQAWRTKTTSQSEITVNLKLRRLQFQTYPVLQPLAGFTNTLQTKLSPIKLQMVNFQRLCAYHIPTKWSPRVLIKSRRTSMYLKKLRVLGLGRKRPWHKLKQKFIGPHSFPSHFGCLILEQARYGSIKMDKVDGSSYSAAKEVGNAWTFNILLIYHFLSILWGECPGMLHGAVPLSSLQNWRRYRWYPARQPISMVLIWSKPCQESPPSLEG